MRRPGQDLNRARRRHTHLDRPARVEDPQLLECEANGRQGHRARSLLTAFDRTTPGAQCFHPPDRIDASFRHTSILRRATVGVSVHSYRPVRHNGVNYPN